MPQRHAAEQYHCGTLLYTTWGRASLHGTPAALCPCCGLLSFASATHCGTVPSQHFASQCLRCTLLRAAQAPRCFTLPLRCAAAHRRRPGLLSGALALPGSLGRQAENLEPAPAPRTPLAQPLEFTVPQHVLQQVQGDPATMHHEEVEVQQGARRHRVTANHRHARPLSRLCQTASLAFTRAWTIPPPHVQGSLPPSLYARPPRRRRGCLVRDCRGERRIQGSMRWMKSLASSLRWR